MKRCSGLSLVEIMVTVAVIAILMSLATPAYTEMLRANRLATETNDLHRALLMARSEAIKRGRRVTLCTTLDGMKCAKGVGWHSGWLMFEDRNGNAQLEPDETVVRSEVRTTNRLSSTGNQPVRDYVSYLPTGAARLVGGGLQMGTLTVCADSSGNELVINSAGRVRVIRRVPC